MGLGADEPVWHPTVFTKNRDRLLEGAVFEEFFSLVVGQARAKTLLSDEHFTVDGTLIEAWAGHKSFQRRKTDDDAVNPPPRDAGNNPTIDVRVTPAPGTAERDAAAESLGQWCSCDAYT